jgi:hypothetical protein
MGVDNLKKYLMIMTVLAVVIFASGCLDTGSNGNNTSNQSNQITIPLTNQLELNITNSDNSTQTYAAGDKVNITFSPKNQSFTVSDKKGTSSGTYNVSENGISLDFGDSIWGLTFSSDGTFTATKGNAHYDGTYVWV